MMNPNLRESIDTDNLPPTVLDERLKQLWSMAFRTFHEKAREADNIQSPELAARLRAVAMVFYPSKLWATVPIDAVENYAAVYSAYANLREIVKIANQSGGLDMVKMSEDRCSDWKH